MTEKKEPGIDELDKAPKRRESAFAARMAKKRSNLDQKISKLRKKASTGNVKKDEVFESTEKIEHPGPDKTTSTKAEAKSSRSKLEKSATKKLADTPSGTHPSTRTGVAKKEKDKQKLASEAVPAVKPRINSKTKTEDTKVRNTARKPLSDIKPVQSARNTPSDRAVPNSGSSRTGAFTGLGAGSKNTNAKPLINGFLEKLDAYPDLSFLNDYKLIARDILSCYSSVKPAVLVLSDTPGKGELLTVECNKKARSLLSDFFPTTKETHSSDTSSCADFEAVVRAGWPDIGKLGPVQIGALREHIDLILIESFPRDVNGIQLASALQRLSGNGRQIILSGSEFISAQTHNSMASNSARRGFSVLDESRITELEIGDNNNLLEAYSARMRDSASETEYRPFVTNRRVFELASQLENRCDYELNKLTLVSAVCGPGAAKYDPTQLEKGLDAKISKILSEGRKQVSPQEVNVDSLGQAILSGQESSLDTASALVSGFSIDDVVMLDELDMQKFSPEDRKYINRIQRFRFASKLGNVWKLRQEYIESLHEKLLSRISSDIEGTFAKADNYFKKSLKDLENAHTEEQKGDIRTLAQELLSSWPSSQQLTASIKIKNNISHFRSALFSKRGSNAPIETQQGVMKELRESRMFVSQLMAFGMLFALLFGSSFAVDVLVSWFSGGSDSIGSELTQAAKDSRGLGRQIRILIQAVAGVAIIIYISLRFYLKPAEKLLNRGKLVSTYSAQLEDVCASFLDEADKAGKDLIQSHIQHLQQKYDEIKTHSLEQGSSLSMVGTGDGTGTTRNETIRAIQDIKKWMNSQIVKKETISISKTLDGATSALLAKITQ